MAPTLPDSDQPEAKKRTYLVAVLDDFSRLIPHAEFYRHEKLPHLENTLQKAILKRGIPHVLYVDNGQIFSAHQINLICAELGIRKITSKPYSPEGKIERFFRTVRADFLTELEHEKVDHLHQLNSKFWAWIEQAWNTYGPWQRPLVHIAMAKALLQKGKDQHISFYLQEIITTHLNHQNKPNTHNSKE